MSRIDCDLGFGRNVGGLAFHDSDLSLANDRNESTDTTRKNVRFSAKLVPDANPVTKPSITRGRLQCSVTSDVPRFCCCYLQP